jgi:hypothetical protein
MESERAAKAGLCMGGKSEAHGDGIREEMMAAIRSRCGGREVLECCSTRFDG